MEKSELDEGERYILEDCLARVPAISIEELKAELVSYDNTTPVQPTAKDTCEHEECEPIAIGNEEMMQHDVARYLFNRLIAGTANEELIVRAKEIIGEKGVDEVIKKAKNTPAEEKEKLIAYLNSFG
jgi:hypothetical protein